MELSKTNLHSHKCRRCGTIWRHDRETIPEGQSTAAHTCPKADCGGTQFMIHCDQAWGDAVPADFCHNGARTLPVPADDVVGLIETPRPERVEALPEWLW